MPSNGKKFEIISIYGECEYNSRAATRLYADRYHHPHNYYLVPLKSSWRSSGELLVRQGNIRLCAKHCTPRYEGRPDGACAITTMMYLNIKS